MIGGRLALQVVTFPALPVLSEEIPTASDSVVDFINKCYLS